MMLFSMSDIVYKPIYPLKTMIIIGALLAVIVLLNRKSIINRLLIIALLLIISQRPMLKNQDEATYNLNIDVLFVIDNTVSMNAIDVNDDTRLNAVKKDCNQIIDLLTGANFAVVNYGNVSIVKHPFTTETSTIKDVIETMKIIDPVYAKGSSLNMPHDNMKILLESSNKKEKHYRVVFFIGDGELIGQEKLNTNLDEYSDLKDLINNGLVLGYGTSTGAKVKIEESVAIGKVIDSKGFLINGTSGEAAISKIDEENLKKLASTLSLDYHHMPDSAFLQEKIEAIKEQSIMDDNGEEELDKDIYYYFSGALIILLILELLHYRRNER